MTKCTIFTQPLSSPILMLYLAFSWRRSPRLHDWLPCDRPMSNLTLYPVKWPSSRQYFPLISMQKQQCLCHSFPLRWQLGSRGAEVGLRAHNSVAAALAAALAHQPPPRQHWVPDSQCAVVSSQATHCSSTHGKTPSIVLHKEQL